MSKMISVTFSVAVIGALLIASPAEARRLHFWWEQQQPEFVPDGSYNYDDQQNADVAEQFNQDQYDRYMREMKHPKRKRYVDSYYDPQVDQPTTRKVPAYKLKKPAPKVVTAKPVVKIPVVAGTPVTLSKPVQIASLANRMTDKVQPKKVDCTKGASIVSDYGFSAVTSKSCVGDTLTYSATRSGKNFEIQVNAASGELTNVKRL